jgi:multidrug efflux pump subunit AcrA (membrane-fusion protein)
MLRRRFGQAVAPMVIALPLLAACTSTPSANLGPPPMPVKLKLLSPETLDETSSYMATLKSRKSAYLQPRVSGIVSKIFVHVGQFVANGAPIVEIDPQQQAATTSGAFAAQRSSEKDRLSAEQTLRSLQATHLSKEANFKYLQREFQRYDWLSKQGAVAKETADNYAMQMKTAEADLSSIAAQIEAQKAAVAKLDNTEKQMAASAHAQQVQLNYYTINAPFAGTVGDIPFRLGEYVDSTTKMTTVTENKPLEVYILVPAEKASALHDGMTVHLNDSQGARIGDASVFFISPVAENSQTVTVKALFDNAQEKLRSNQTVNAQIVWNKATGLKIPATAVAHISGQEFVFVTKGSAPHMVAEQRAVSLGDIIGNDYVVKSGVKPGEHLVTSGVQNLIDGASIAPRP